MSSSSPNQWYFLTEEVDANISSFVMHHIAFGEIYTAANAANLYLR